MIYSRRWNPSPITAEENTYLPARSVKTRRRQTEGGARSQAHRASESPPACIWELFWWNICLRRCVLRFLFNYFSPIWCSPAALYSPYLSSLDFPPCQRASIRLLCLRLEAAWIKQPPNFETMACFAVCLRTNKILIMQLCESLQDANPCKHTRFWIELKPLYLQITIKACGSWSNIQQMTSCKARSDGWGLALSPPGVSEKYQRAFNRCHGSSWRPSNTFIFHLFYASHGLRSALFSVGF